MNVIFLSPGFPPTAPEFCAALAAEGVTVLGIGDAELQLERQQAAGLTRYVCEPRMGEHQALLDAVKSMAEQYGRIDRIECDGEHWLAAAARLRDELEIQGLDAVTLARQRSKLGMAEIFARAEIAHPPGVSAADGTAVRRLAEKYGYPLVFKPDVGSGAVATFKVNSESELQAVLGREPQSDVVQPFIAGDIITFDGLADRRGRLVFWTSHVYDTGIMEVRQAELDGHYYSLRELPSGLEALGRRAVAAFAVRERFFHVEFFRHLDGTFTALEMNLRPPGGFTTDMMNAACDIDVYRLWAAVVAGRDLEGFRFERRYHTAHAGRRAGRNYRLDTATLVHELGEILVVERAIPPAFAATMGDTMYMLRHRDLAELRQAIALVQDQSG
ncbi:MAG TPA: hypothetical protein VEX18_03520 [Polyangiaceae bacterium]|nr:hypothetical protein [Polyangiaceae bacterium]